MTFNNNFQNSLTKKCLTCGNTILPNARFCGRCGTQVSNGTVILQSTKASNKTTSSKQYIIALLVIGIIFSIIFALKGFTYIIGNVNKYYQNTENSYEQLVIGKWELTGISEYGEYEAVTFSSYAVFNDDSTGYISIDDSKMRFTWEYIKCDDGSAYFRCVNLDNEILYATTPIDSSSSVYNNVFIAPEDDPDSMVLVFTKV